MSKFSGKCDIYDSMMISASADLKREDNESELDYELRCFELFKKTIGGKIYKKVKLELNQWNIDVEINKVNDERILSKVEHKEIKKDRRSKSGVRENTYYTYYYFGEEYTNLKDINYYSPIEIKIDTILDLIPYYTHIAGVIASSKDGMYIEVSNESYLDEKEEMYIRNGFDLKYVRKEKEELKRHYNLFVLKLYNDNYKQLESKVFGELNALVESSKKSYKESAENLLLNDTTTTSQYESLLSSYEYSSGFYEGVSQAYRIAKEEMKGRV